MAIIQKNISTPRYQVFINTVNKAIIPNVTSGTMNPPTKPPRYVPPIPQELGLGIIPTLSETPVYTTEEILTEAPLQGGGDLSANRILSIDAVSQTNPGYMLSADKVKLDNATPNSYADTLVMRDINGNFTAGTITGTFNGPSTSFSGFINESQVTNLTTDLGNKTPTTRNVATTLPLTGGGTLASDLTLGINNATDSAAGAMSAADKTKLDAATTNNTAGTIVMRDANGNFTAGTITGTFVGPSSSSSSFTGTINENQVNGLVTDLGNKTPVTRNVNTTLPLTGGGNLMADLNLAINNATDSSPGAMSQTDKSKLDAATNNNTASTIVMRDASGNFSAGVITGSVSSLTRVINTNAPLSGGGTLTADLTLSVSAATDSTAGTMSAADKTKLDASTSLATASTIVVRDSVGAINGSVFYGIANTAVNAQNTTQIEDFYVTFGGEGSPITTGIKTFRPIDYMANITGWTVVSDQPGTITLDIKKATTTAFPTTTSITGSSQPQLNSAQLASGTVTGWTTILNPGDILEFDVLSATTVTFATLALQIKRTALATPTPV